MVGVHNRKTLKLLILGGLKTEKLDDVIQSIRIAMKHKNRFEAQAEGARNTAKLLAFSTFVTSTGHLTCFAHKASARPKVGTPSEFGRSQRTNSRALKIRKLSHRDF